MKPIQPIEHFEPFKHYIPAGFLRDILTYLFTFIQKATNKYTINGEPMVRKEI